MTESIENIIRNSWTAWRKNPILGLPYLFNTIVSIALILLFAASVFLFLNPLKDLPMTGINPQSIDWTILFLDIGLFCLLMLATALISTFFNAGAIGMSYKALETGACSLDDLTSYGGKKFLTLFLTDLLIFIPVFVVAIGLLFVQMIFPGDFVTILSLAAGIILAMVPYAVVIGDKGPVEGIKTGMSLFKENKFQTTMVYAFTYYFLFFSIYAVVLACMAICSLSLFFIPLPPEMTAQSMLSALMPAVGIIAVAVSIAAVFYILVETMILTPLINLIWTSYYISKTKQRREA